MNAIASTLQKAQATTPSNSQLNIGLLLFRVLAALALMRTHGLPKILDFAGTIAHIPDPLGIWSNFFGLFCSFC